MCIKLYKKKTNIKTKIVTNTLKRPLIAKHLIDNTYCVNSYMLSRFRVVSHCKNVIYLVRLDAIKTLLSLNKYFQTNRNNVNKNYFLFF